MYSSSRSIVNCMRVFIWNLVIAAANVGWAAGVARWRFSATRLLMAQQLSGRRRWTIVCDGWYSRCESGQISMGVMLAITQMCNSAQWCRLAVVGGALIWAPAHAVEPWITVTADRRISNRQRLNPINNFAKWNNARAKKKTTGIHNIERTNFLRITFAYSISHTSNTCSTPN